MIKCVEKSSNSKIGKGVACTYRQVGPTCPQTCQHLSNKSCYAMYAFVGIHQKKSGYDNDDKTVIADFVKNLPSKHKVRHHVSGDVMKPGNLIDHEYIDSLLDAHKNRPDLMGWTYTHVYEQLDPKKLNANKSLTVNASCDSIEQAKEAKKNGWPATVTVPEDFESSDGIVVCPNQTHDVSCKDCMLCFRKKRAIVGFRVHGSGKSKF